MTNHSTHESPLPVAKEVAVPGVGGGLTPTARMTLIALLVLLPHGLAIGWTGLERGTSETPGLPSQVQSSPGDTGRSATSAQETEPSENATQDAAETLGTVVSGMQRVATDLKDKQQVTEETFALQAKVLTSLDELIKLADKLPQTKRQQQSSPQPNQKPNAKPQQNDSTEKRTQQTENRRDDQQSQNSTDNVKSGNATDDSPAARRRVLVQEIWGHLPAAMQRRLMSGSSEKPLPKYQRLVEKYFEAIAEPGTSSKRTGRQATPPKADEKPPANGQK